MIQIRIKGQDRDQGYEEIPVRKRGRWLNLIPGQDRTWWNSWGDQLAIEVRERRDGRWIKIKFDKRAHNEGVMKIVTAGWVAWQPDKTYLIPTRTARMLRRAKIPFAIVEG